MVFGHGLFGDAQIELDTSYQRQLGQYLCMVQIGTELDRALAGRSADARRHGVPDFNQLHIITDRLQQAHVNAQVLTRLVLHAMKDDPALALNGTPVIDGATATTSASPTAASRAARSWRSPRTSRAACSTCRAPSGAS